jgi:hypothetical protein
MRLEGSNDRIGFRIRDLPACSTVPQRSTLPRAPRGGIVRHVKVMLALNQERPRVAFLVQGSVSSVEHQVPS